MVDEEREILTLRSQKTYQKQNRSARNKNSKMPATAENQSAASNGALPVPSTSVSEIQNTQSERIRYLDLVPDFNGAENECIEFFFNSFENIALSANWQKSQYPILVKSKLKKLALSFLTKDISMQTESNYDVLKQMLRDNFLNQKTDLEKYAEFNAIVQTPQISVTQLALKIKSAAKLLAGPSSPLPDKVILTRFCDALVPQIRFQVKLANPITLDQAVHTAQVVELALREKNDVHVNMVATSSESTQDNNQIVIQNLQKLNFDQANKLKELEKKLREKEIPTATVCHINTVTDNDQSAQISCEFCNKVNSHLSADCYFRPDRVQAYWNNYYANQSYPQNFQTGNRRFGRRSHNYGNHPYYPQNGPNTNYGYNANSNFNQNRRFRSQRGFPSNKNWNKKNL